MSKDLGVDVTGLIECLERIKVFSFHSIKSVVSLFQEVANHMLESGLEKAKFRKSKTSLIKEADMPFYMNKMLRALFATAKEGVEAERGSVMLLDHKLKTLSIMISKGIPSDITDGVKVKYGEGIAGWVVRENKPIFVDEDFKEPRLQARLHQPQLQASLSVPLSSGKNTFGVLNLSTKKKNHKFTRETINSIIQLTRMVDTALNGINQDATVL